MRQLSEAILIFITFFIKINSQKTEEKQETKPDPFFQEWKENAWQRPTQCQVCRLLVTELYDSLNRTNKKDVLQTGYELDGRKVKSITYEKSEIRLLETIENVCDQMKSYVSRARRKFPYVKGVKSHFREGLDNLVENSAVKLNIEKPPDDLVDDSTKEIIRLKFKCVHMLEQYEEEITEWYFEHREQDLMEWLCIRRVLNNEDQGCLGDTDELIAPENETTTTIFYATEEGTETKSMTPEERKEKSEDERQNGDDEIDFSESHLEL